MTTTDKNASPADPAESFEGFAAFLAGINERLTPEQEPFAKLLFSSGCEWRRLAHRLFSYGSVLDYEARRSSARNVCDDGPAGDQKAADPDWPVDVDDRDRSAPGADSGRYDAKMVILELLARNGEEKLSHKPPRLGLAVALSACIVKAAAFLLLKVVREKRNRIAASAMWKTAKDRRAGFRIRLHNRHPERCGKLCQLVYIAVDRRINDVFTSKERPQDIEVLLQSNEIRRAECERSST